MTADERPQKGRTSIGSVARIIFSLFVFLVALGLIYGGIKLVALGGSAYYLIAGLAYLVLTALMVKSKRAALPVSVVIFVATLIWALCDVVHFSYWELLPRLVLPALILMVSLWVTAAFPGTASAPRRAANGFGGAIFLALLATLVAAFFPHGTTLNPVATQDAKDAVASSNDAQAPENWEFYGRSASGTRFAPYSDITPENVKDLQVAWTYHTGRRTTGSAFGVDENTPLQIGNVLYTCTPENVVAAVDGDSGKELWKFQTGSGVVAPPVTWEQDGEQMIAVVTGWGGAVPLWGGDVAKRVNFLEQGGSVWVFKLHKGS